MDIMVMLRDDYFSKCENSLTENNDYCNHVNKFIEYLCLPEVNLSDAPARINRDVVEECIKYYHDKGELNSRSTMESCLESVKNFYDYLRDTGKATDIFDGYSYIKFKDDIVEKYGLLEPVEKGIYDCEDIKTILVNLDKVIENFQGESDGFEEEEKYLQRIILRLFIKLTLIAPAKRSVIASVKKSNIKEEFKKVSINGIDINIPCGLSRDLCTALKYAEAKNGESIKESDNIFEYVYRYKGKFNVENLNAWFYNLAQDFGILENERKDKETLSVEPIRNMVIQMMVDNMTNPVFISKITGITLPTIEEMFYPKDWKVKREKNIDKCINKSIAQNDCYCYV